MPQGVLMKRRLFNIAGIPAVLLVFWLAAAVIGCNNGTTGDTWSDITSLDQMDGTWNSAYSQDDKPVLDVIEEMDIPLPSDPAVSLMLGMLTGIKVNIIADITLTINAAAKTQATSVASTSTFSGGNIVLFWPFLKQSLESLEEEGVTITTNDANYSVTMLYDNPPEELSDEDITEMLNSGLQINQDGTKIKVPADSMIGGVSELIFEKQ